jgi:cytochrome P450
VRGGLPSGSPLPALGQMIALNARPFATLDAWRRRHGPCFTVRSPGMPPLVFIADPDEAQAVFRAPADVLHPGEGGAAIMPIVGERSFMLADGAAHLTGRVLLRRAFAASTAQRHAGVLAATAERELASWPRDRPVAVHPRLRAFALRTIVHTIFGDRDPRLGRLVQGLLTMLEMTSSIVLPVPPARRIPPFRGVWRRFLADRREVDQLLFELIEARRRAPGRSDDTLELLTAARTEDGLPLPDRYVRDTIMSVVLAGHETTSSALAWAFLLLAHHPAAQRLAAEEVAGGGEPAYLRATIQEVLRHRPVFVFAIPRAVKQPIQIGPRIYDAPAHLLPCIYLIQHDPRAYARPSAFRPERFLDAQPDPATWLPWGGGRKRCPGRHLALLELESVLGAALAQGWLDPAAPRLEEGRFRSVIVTPRWGGRVVLRARAGARLSARTARSTDATRAGSAPAGASATRSR